MNYPSNLFSEKSIFIKNPRLLAVFMLILTGSQDDYLFFNGSYKAHISKGYFLTSVHMLAKLIGGKIDNLKGDLELLERLGIIEISKKGAFLMVKLCDVSKFEVENEIQ
jgi:hypothetical protein